MRTSPPITPPTGPVLDGDLRGPGARLRHLERSSSAAVAVGSIVVVAFALYAALGLAASVPRFFMDELYYMKAGVSLAQGHGLQFEGSSWGYGPLYPLLIGAIVRATPDQQTSYEVLKVANAAFFALALVPIYLVARRLLTSRQSLAVVVLSAAIPSSMYVSVSMTESLGYVLAWWALYAVVLVLERPTAARQLAALGSLAVAIAARPQFVALYAGYVLSVGALALAGRGRTRPASFWPTALSVLGGLAWLAWPVVHGRGVGHALGSYSALDQSYRPLAVAKWLVFELGDLALYLGIVPLVIAPAVLLRWRAHSRAGSRPAAALGSLFVAQNLAGVALIAAFASTPAGLGILYDRYLFYLAPLWLLVLVFWVADGMPRPPVPIALGAVTALVVAAALPPRIVGGENWFRHFEAVATGVWGKVGLVTTRLPLVSVRTAVIACALVAVAAIWLPRRHRARALVAIVVIAFAANLSIAWRSAFVDARSYGLGVGKTTWVDDRIGGNASVTALVVSRPCAAASEQRFAALETDYFNRSIRSVATLGGEGGGAASALVVGPDGRLARNSGAALAADYVVAPPGVALDGVRLARGTAARLALWKVGGSVRVTNARSSGELLATPCGG